METAIDFAVQAMNAASRVAADGGDTAGFAYNVNAMLESMRGREPTKEEWDALRALIEGAGA